jgi:aspartokinase
MRNKVADLAVENGPDIMRRIAEFAGTIRATRGESLRVVVGFQSIRVIADRKALEAFRQTLRPNEIIRYSDDLAEISLLFPSEATNTKGIIAKISAELALNDVNLVGITCNSPEDILLVTEADAPRALEALQRMLREEATNTDWNREPSKIVLAN